MLPHSPEFLRLNRQYQRLNFLNISSVSLDEAWVCFETGMHSTYVRQAQSNSGDLSKHCRAPITFRTILVVLLLKVHWALSDPTLLISLKFFSNSFPCSSFYSSNINLHAVPYTWKQCLLLDLLTPATTFFLQATAASFFTSFLTMLWSHHLNLP